MAATARGQPQQLPASVYQAALRAARTGGQPEDREPGPLPSRRSLPPTQPAPAVTSAAPPAPTGPIEQRLAVGLDLMRQFLPEGAALLEPWADKLPELAHRAAAAAKGGTDQLPSGVYEAASQAVRAGGLLERERAARPVAVPAAMAPHEKEIQRVQARFYAVKHGQILSGEMLRSLSPRRILGVLEEVRRTGLADEGPGWAFRQKGLVNLVNKLAPALKREMEHDQGLG
jgi:hypothetical protein